MFTIRQAGLELFRNRLKFILMTISISLIFFALQIGWRFYLSSEDAKETMLNYIGPYMMLTNADDTSACEIDDEIVRQIQNLSYVRGVNKSIADYGIAENFTTVKEHTGEEPSLDPALYADYENLTPASVTLKCNLDTEQISDFRLGNSHLIEGEFPTDDNSGVLIEEHLAEQNQLELGDMLTLSRTDGSKITVAVLGIYQTKGYFEIDSTNAVGEAVYAWSPYNCIYASLDIGCDFFKVDAEGLALYIYTTSLTKMDQVASEIKQLEIDWENYILYNMTETDYTLDQNSYQIELLNSYSLIILGYTAAVGFVVIELLFRIYTAQYLKNIAIYRALGLDKKSTIKIFLCSLGMMLIAAGILSTALTQIFSSTLFSTFLNSNATPINKLYSYQNGLNLNIEVGLLGLSAKNYALFILYGGTLLLVGCLPLLIKMTRYSTRKLFLAK